MSPNRTGKKQGRGLIVLHAIDLVCYRVLKTLIVKNFETESHAVPVSLKLHNRGWPWISGLPALIWVLGLQRSITEPGLCHNDDQIHSFLHARQALFWVISLVQSKHFLRSDKHILLTHSADKAVRLTALSCDSVSGHKSYGKEYLAKLQIYFLGIKPKVLDMLTKFHQWATISPAPNLPSDPLFHLKKYNIYTHICVMCVYLFLQDL